MICMSKLRFTAVFAAIAVMMAVILLSHSGSGFVVKEYNGKIGIFGKAGSALQETINVRIEDLPFADRQRLASGISAQNDEQLCKIIEDFDG